MSIRMKDFERMLEESEEAVRAGLGSIVAKRLSGLNTAKIPRQLRLRFANLCRRAGLVPLGMKVLTPVVRPDRPREADPATAAEQSEYAMLLQRTGATREALQTLSKVDTAKAPEALLYQAFCHFSRWSEEDAIPLLERYLASPLSSYWSLVGRVNLASAYLGTRRYQEAMELLDSNLKSAAENNYVKMQANCLELRAQANVKLGEISKARADLDLAAKLLASIETPDQLYARKWIAILDSLEQKDSDSLLGFRASAVEKREWESVRDADRYLLVLEFEQDRFDHLAFGTPYESFRRYLSNEFPTALPSLRYHYGTKRGPTLVVATGELDGRPTFNPGKKTHQLIDVLLKDLYRPVPLGALFSELFPGDHFDIFSSPDRIHQVLRRARRQIEELELPIAIVEDRGVYSLELEGPFTFALDFLRGKPEGPSVEFDKLAKIYQIGEYFGAREAREALGIPRTSFQRLIAWGLESGKLEKSGDRNATLYRVASGFTR